MSLWLDRPSKALTAALSIVTTVTVLGCSPSPSPDAPAALEPPGTATAAADRIAGSSAVYRNAALAAARWIRSTAITTDAGKVWPADPLDTASVVTNLYTGTPGVVLFFLDLAAHTGDDSFLDDARAGADFLADRLDAAADVGPENGTAERNGPGGGGADPTMAQAGLYTGLAGVGFALQETYKATGDERYHEAAMRAVTSIHEQARAVGAGVAWVDSADIVSGSAGIGLFLLYAAREMNHPESLALARDAGLRLLEVAESHETGLGWRINEEYPRLMPNFSHGTAGVAYFLAALHEAGGEYEFLDAAVAGANRLLSLAETEGDVCLVLHHTDGGEGLQYLSWCHGPAGTARTFYKLWQITGDEQWMAWTERSANGVYDSGIPETLTDGFWNNVGQCCGSAGVAEFALAMDAVHGADSSAESSRAKAAPASIAESRHLAFARRVTDDLLARASEEGDGMLWVQAENRVQPDFLVAQTGYMQGAAGIGMMLLHLAAVIDGDSPARIMFPDSPF